MIKSKTTHTELEVYFKIWGRENIKVTGSCLHSGLFNHVVAEYIKYLLFLKFLFAIKTCIDLRALYLNSACCQNFISIYLFVDMPVVTLHPWHEERGSFCHALCCRTVPGKQKWPNKYLLATHHFPFVHSSGRKYEKDEEVVDLSGKHSLEEMSRPCSTLLSWTKPSKKRTPVNCKLFSRVAKRSHY